MSVRSVIHFIKPCRDPVEDHRVLTPQYAMGMLGQGHIVRIGLDNCTLQRMEELPAKPSRAAAEAVGLLPLVEFLERAPGVALTAMGTHEMPENRVAKAKWAYESFCAAFWPDHRDDVEASHRKFDDASTDRWVEFTELSDGARCVYGLAYVALLQMQNIRRTYPSLSPEEKFEAYLHSMAGMLDLVCSGLMKPDTHLGENARQIEVSDDQTTSFLFR
ncbi:transcriptional factor [Pseudomonas syringae]|nr:transcriptional factor [Pseudomonas syringae]